MTFRLSALAALALLGATAPDPSTMAIRQGQDLLARGDVDGAAGAFDRAIALNPRNPDAVLNAANLVRDRYGLLPSLAWYERALQVKPDHLDILFEKAATLGDAGRSSEMLAVTRQLLALSPDNAQGCYLQAVLLARAGQWDLARTILYRAGNRMDGIGGMALMRATLMLQSGSNDGAIAQLRPLLDAKPDNARARRLLGLALVRSGSAIDAVEVLHPLADQGDGYALWMTGRALETTGDVAGAVEALDRAATARSGVIGADQLAALDAFLASNPANVAAQRAAADRALSRGEWEAADALYASLAARLGNRDPVRLANTGWAQVGLGDTAAAVELGARAYAIAPMSPLVTASYGAFLARAGKPREAVPILEKAVAMVPDQPRFAQELAAARKSL